MERLCTDIGLSFIGSEFTVAQSLAFYLFNILANSLSLIQAKEEEVHQMRLDIGKLNKIREQIHKKLHLIEDQKAEVEQHKETLKNQILGLERGKSLCFYS